MGRSKRSGCKLAQFCVCIYKYVCVYNIKNKAACLKVRYLDKIKCFPKVSLKEIGKCFF